MKSKRLNRLGLFSFPMILVMLLALGLRVWGVQAQSLSMDEVYEVQLASTSAKQIVSAADGFPPLYHILLWAWLKVFQNQESSRWLSVLFGCLAVPTVWKLASRLGGTGWWAAFLLALSPFHVWYSQEARVYSLYFLEATLALWFFLRALETDRARDWALYGLAILAGLYTHYYFSILLVVNGVVLLTEKRTWQDLKLAFVAHAGVGLLALPSLWLLRADLAHQTSYTYQTPFDGAALGYTYFSFLGGYAIGPSLRELHVLSPGTAIFQFLPWLLLVGGALLVLGLQGLMDFEDTAIRRRLIILTLIPVLLCGLLSETFEVGYNIRHILWAAIPLYILLGKGAGRSIHQWSIRLCLIALCALFAVSTYNRRFVERYQNEDARKAAAYLTSQSNPDVPIFVMAGYMQRPILHYLGSGWSVHPVPDVGRQGKELGSALGFIKVRVEDGSPFWLAYTREFNGDPGGWFKKTLLERGMIQHKAKFAGIELYQGKA